MQLLALAFASLCLLNGVQPLLRLPLQEFVEVGSFRGEDFTEEKFQKQFGNLTYSGPTAGTLTSYKDSRYYGTLLIGTPPQEFKVIFDSFTPLVWVPSIKCESSFCKTHSKFDPSKSFSCRNYGKSFVVNYPLGDVSGFLTIDNINVSGLLLRNQTFGEATKVPDFALSMSYFDGVVGMRFPTFDEKDHFLMNMYSQKLIDAAVFSVYLNKDTEKGEILFGGSDPNLYKCPLHYVEFINRLYFEFLVDKIVVGGGGKTLCKDGCTTTVSTGATRIAGPPKDIDELAAAVGAIPLNGEYVVDCMKVEELPDLSFVINNISYTLSAKDYVVPVKSLSKPLCILGFSGIEQSDLRAPHWILGTIFISKYYVEFDLNNNRIGFAESYKK